MISVMSWISGCNSIHFIWKFEGNIFISTECCFTCINWWFFRQSWNLFSNSFTKTESMAVYSLLFRALWLASVSTCNYLPSLESALYSTALPPCPTFSWHRVNRALMVGCCWVMGVCQEPLWGNSSWLYRARSGAGCIVSCAGPQVAHGPHIGHAWTVRFLL